MPLYLLLVQGGLLGKCIQTMYVQTSRSHWLLAMRHSVLGIGVHACIRQPPAVVMGPVSISVICRWCCMGSVLLVVGTTSWGPEQVRHSCDSLPLLLLTLFPYSCISPSSLNPLPLPVYLLLSSILSVAIFSPFFFSPVLPPSLIPSPSPLSNPIVCILFSAYQRYPYELFKWQSTLSQLMTQLSVPALHHTQPPQLAAERVNETGY